jgi:hypothetical protein
MIRAQRAQYFRSGWPKPADMATYRLARLVIRNEDKVAQHDISFVRSVAVAAMSDSSTAQQRARLKGIAQRLKVFRS